MGIRIAAARTVARAIVTAALLAALTAVVAATLRLGGVRADDNHGRPLLWYAAAWALFGAAAWTVRKVPVRAATVLVLVGGAAIAVAALVAPPRTSDDMYRYAWDGRVQAAGISPYAYPPAAPELAALRDGWLFPQGTVCDDWQSHQVGDSLCTLINRPTVHTIYPPVAEGWFLAVHEVSPAGARHKPAQIGGALLATGTTLALLAVLRRRGGDPRGAALWAWCPAVPFDAVNNAHIDTLGVLLTVLALGTGRPGARRGVWLGGAIAVKLLPVLALPGALSGRPGPGRTARVVLGAALAVGLAYLPYVLASGAGVLGYLPGYLHEEGYASGDVRRFALLRLLLPGRTAGPAVVLLIAATALYVWRRGDCARPWRGALLVTGTALLLTSPAYPWYALLVVALVALDGRWEWLAIPAAGAALYVGGVQQSVSYGAAGLVVLGGTLIRRTWSRKGGGPRLYVHKRESPREDLPV
ncbi:glycosyltransferase family 87 protein [Actinacidiphila soli]|uniref:glycosyltransferase family 87 protein n=1 Tax=Actinacidiphila soli TaxID=2487275 RepID=UPI001F0C0A4D|nr:glycosyltransferase family 87 protein [Actinacidiphila soli]